MVTLRHPKDDEANFNLLTIVCALHCIY